jgi:GNAT superfamily N-acetyltransferase
MNIRPARPNDADEISRVLRASIEKLCFADHRGDEQKIGRWTANKTVEPVAEWIAAPEPTLLLAVESGGIVCVGGYLDEGKIVLNYVAPETRFRGISKAMLARIEAELAANGVSEAPLESTATAHRFYRAAGWRNDGPPQLKFDLPCHAMIKSLGAHTQ